MKIETHITVVMENATDHYETTAVLATRDVFDDDGTIQRWDDSPLEWSASFGNPGEWILSAARHLVDMIDGDSDMMSQGTMREEHRVADGIRCARTLVFAADGNSVECAICGARYSKLEDAEVVCPGPAGRTIDITPTPGFMQMAAAALRGQVDKSKALLADADEIVGTIDTFGIPDGYISRDNQEIIKQGLALLIAQEDARIDRITSGLREMGVQS